MKVAVVFPGQGSQSVSMMSAYGDSVAIRATFEEASATLGRDLWSLVQQGPVEALNQTVNTQPVMLTAGVAVWRSLSQRLRDRVSFAAGHSLGEYSALVAAGALSFSDALQVVQARAEAMQRAVPEGTGGIAAILGLEEEQIQAVCRDAALGEVLEAANLNAPGQIVVAGHRAAVERGMALAKERGAKRVVMLPMSAPSHCSLMAPAAQLLGERLAAVKVTAPVIPVLHNRDLSSHGDADAIRRALVEQVTHPVRWIETVKTLAANGVTHILECGPGKVLTGLNKRIVDGVACLSLHDAASLAEAEQLS